MHKPWLHQVLNSVNVAIVVVSMLSQKGNSALLGLLEYPASTCLFPLLRAIYHDSSFERSYGFYAASLLLAALIYLLIRVVNYFSRLRPLLLPTVSRIQPFGTWRSMLFSSQFLASFAV